ncbi:hypothetical protein SAMN02799636_04292 [Methylobacterium sp. 275MFSha3.1]|uniref:hypothetical protein n=1 Tax=Methylobacterium sp. 275MFSha3.1 TaxID=1502746 RepID=UPI0008A730DF|nr:hypothetical protein [Methylobacterium sp. 275MFSha3.1]SEH88773.1 hypothetical protein SAMN02799636_04292 [Methylobacterium sp. 275MFSha3.1]
MARYKPDIPEFKNPKTGKDYTRITNEMRMAHLAAKLALANEMEMSLRRTLDFERKRAETDRRTAELSARLDERSRELLAAFPVPSISN